MSLSYRDKGGEKWLLKDVEGTVIALVLQVGRVGDCSNHVKNETQHGLWYNTLHCD